VREVDERIVFLEVGPEKNVCVREELLYTNQVGG
jgi:hypothetical protein